MLLAGRFRCRQIPAFCDDVDWPVLEWEMLLDQDGNALSGEAQEESWFYTPTDREGEYAVHLYRITHTPSDNISFDTISLKQARHTQQKMVALERSRQHFHPLPLPLTDYAATISRLP